MDEKTNRPRPSYPLGGANATNGTPALVVFGPFPEGVLIRKAVFAAHIGGGSELSANVPKLSVGVLSNKVGTSALFDTHAQLLHEGASLTVPQTSRDGTNQDASVPPWELPLNIPMGGRDRFIAFRVTIPAAGTNCTFTVGLDVDYSAGSSQQEPDA